MNATTASPCKQVWNSVVVLALALNVWVASSHAADQKLTLPPRPADALSGTQIAARISALDLSTREQEILDQVSLGNVPNFLRQLCPISVTHVANGVTNSGIFYATADYFAVGSDADYFLAPISPTTAQRIADTLGCRLPTRKMVDDIYAAAEVKLSPSPIPPSPAMTTVEVFAIHNTKVQLQRQARRASKPGALVAGHKKDIVISVRLAAAQGKVAIYGWHRTNGEAIQPLYLGHSLEWVDYSQCTRLVQREMLVNGKPKSIDEVLSDPALAGLLSDEGVIPVARYPTNAPPGEKLTKSARPKTDALTPASARVPSALAKLAELIPCRFFPERTGTFTNESGVRTHINAPAKESFDSRKKVLLVFYALPNGNTIEQTVGKQFRPEDDWHFDIQHIGAQTRFLRERLPQYNLALAYLENNLKSWPAWRKKYGDEPFIEIIERVKRMFSSHDLEIVLNGHSGGGSLIFGYINALETIPSEIVRIGFLDSNYAYNRSLGHYDKLSQWLNGPKAPHLCVLAYNDAAALLNGKSFVSAAGGTWGRSHAMLKDFSEQFQFTSRTNGEFTTHSGLNGRIQFILRENPERKIYHTVQVERNGFIHSMVSGTTNENRGYQYFGERAYTSWVQAE